ncbi:hypothetical protein [Saccharospirillum salsuginis]|nr:hypothetical protein [Saccharospirillum salsuginis]
MTTNPQKKTFAPSSPEEGLMIRPDAEPMNSDMLEAIVNRSNALLDVLTGYFSTPANERPFILKDVTLANLVWQLRGNSDLINMIIVNHADNSPDRGWPCK